MTMHDRPRPFLLRLPALALAAALAVTASSFATGTAAFAKDATGTAPAEPTAGPGVPEPPESEETGPAQPDPETTLPVTTTPDPDLPDTTQAVDPPAPPTGPNTPDERAPVQVPETGTTPLDKDPAVGGAGAIRYESEPNNDRSKADTLPLATDMRGAAADRWDTDYYRIDLPKAGRVKLQFTFPTSVSGDAYDIRVENSNGNAYNSFELTGSDANGSRLANFAIFLPAGPSFIKVHASYNDAVVGKQYTLRADHTAGTVETEFNDDRSTADPLKLGTAILGASTDRWDPDYYRIDLPKAGRVKLQFTFPTSVSGDAYDIRVENSNGNAYNSFELTGSDANGSRLANFAIFLPAGPSFIKVHAGYNEAVVGKQYTLRADHTAGTVETEFNDDRSTADPLAFGATILGASADRWDDDLYAMTASRTGTGYLNFVFPKSVSGPAYSVAVLDVSGSTIQKFELEGSQADGTSLSRHGIRFPAGQFFIKVSPNYNEAVVGKAYSLSFGQKLTPATPMISGTAKAGSTLTAKPGAWGPAPVTFAYQWLRDGKPISRATKSTYAVTQSDRGTYLSVAVTGSKSGFTSQTRTSAKKLAPATYIDVLRSNVHFAGVEWMAKQVYAKSGPSAPRYYPSNATTRGAFATMLMRMNEPGYTPPSKLKLPFTDVTKSDAHYKGIAWMYQRGYAAKASKFNAANPVTRGALATFMQRMEAPSYTPKSTLKLPYTDISTRNVHYKGIAWMYQKGYAAKASKYHPTNSTTRGAMATFLYRMNG